MTKAKLLVSSILIVAELTLWGCKGENGTNPIDPNTKPGGVGSTPTVSLIGSLRPPLTDLLVTINLKDTVAYKDELYSPAVDLKANDAYYTFTAAERDWLKSAVEKGDNRKFKLLATSSTGAQLWFCPDLRNGLYVRISGSPTRGVWVDWIRPDQAQFRYEDGFLTDDPKAVGHGNMTNMGGKDPNLTTRLVIGTP